MKKLDNVKVKSKLLTSLAVMVLFLLVIAGVGFVGLRSEKGHLDKLSNEHYYAITNMMEYLNDVEGARVALVTMLSSANAGKINLLEGMEKGDISTAKAAVKNLKPDPSKLNPLKEKVDSLTKDGAASLDKVINSPYSDEGMKKAGRDINEAWSVFVKTRDGELIPLIYDGKIEEANQLGLGIQAERYKKFTEMAHKLIESEQAEAATAVAAAEAASKWSMMGMIGAAVIAIIIGIIISMVIANNISNRIFLVAGAAELMADGNIGKTVDVSGNDEIGMLAASFNKMAVNLKNLIGGIGQASNQIASSSEELSTTAEQMSKGAQTQTSQTSQIATAMEEMSSTVLEVAKNSQSAASSANAASSLAQKGGEVVALTVEGMKRIAETVQGSARTVEELGKNSDQIGEIVGVIDDIADQTNLLALNAAIEAARAGEQGRGFAVVADEVRKLAERTTKATKEIAAMIKKIQKDTVGAVAAMEAGTKEVGEGVNLASQAGESLMQIVNSVQTVNDMIRQIATAAEQQSTAAEQISKSIEEIAGVTKETASGTHQTASASHELSRMAVELQGMVGQFKI